jgi:uncharacterized protein with HEPN domain
VKTPDDVVALKNFLPESNWQRYFRNIVKCDDTYLKSRWDKLYDLRCKVAHNALMTASDLAQIEKLISEVKPKLLEAIAELSKVSVPSDEVEAVAEGAIRGISTAIGDFISMWQQIESITLRRLAVRKIRLSRNATAQDLVDNGILDEANAAMYDEMRRLRNTIVHGPTNEIPVDVILGCAVPLRSLLEAVQSTSFVEKLTELSEDERKIAIEERLDDTKQDIVESEVFCGRMAETNAGGWDIDEMSVESFEVDLEDDVCVVNLGFVASGEQHEERMYCGARIVGNALAVIDCNGDVMYENIAAEVESETDE